MTEQNIPVTPDELLAYADGELPADRREAVEAWLATHPDDAATLASWRSMDELLHAKYDAVADEPVPPHLNIDVLSQPPRRLMYAAIAATLAAFLIGGGAGWYVRGAGAQPAMVTSLTSDALEAHKLYVVDVRHPVEVAANERAHLQQWLTKRCGWDVKAPELDTTGLRLVGGRLLPGPTGPASFFMYETANGERVTIYASRATGADTQMRYASQDNDGALYWADRGLGYVVTGPMDKERLAQVAKQVYDQAGSTKL